MSQRTELCASGQQVSVSLYAMGGKKGRIYPEHFRLSIASQKLHSFRFGFPDSITTFHPPGIGPQALSQAFPSVELYNHANRSHPIQTFLLIILKPAANPPLWNLQLAFCTQYTSQIIKFSNYGMVLHNSTAYYIIRESIYKMHTRSLMQLHDMMICRIMSTAEMQFKV